MPFWNPITEADIMSRFSDAERAALRSLQVIPDQLATVISKEVKAARGKIKAGGGQLGLDGTIPDSVQPEVVSIAIWRWITAFSKNTAIQSDVRKQNYTDALAVLKDISLGKQKVELPDAGTTDDTASASNAIQVASNSNRQFTRRKLRGL